MVAVVSKDMVGGCAVSSTGRTWDEADVQMVSNEMKGWRGPECPTMAIYVRQQSRTHMRLKTGKYFHLSAQGRHTSQDVNVRI